MGIQLNFKCNESWEKMSLSSAGRFCDNCSKNVFDLTDKSDTEIRQLYADNKGKMCGRIKQSQIGIPFMSEQKRVLAKFCLALYLVFGSFIFSNVVKGQNIIENKVNKVENTYSIKGQVVDSNTGEGIAFAGVDLILKGKVIKEELTDSLGNYTIELTNREMKNKPFDIQVSYVGYFSTKVEDIKLGNKRELVVDINLEEAEILLGDIMIEEHPIIEDSEQ